jgi:hypothetical protein
MARENQDLQIALIVSVMLTIILGVATFLFYRSKTDTEKSLQAALADGAKKSRDADAARDEVGKLKKDIIGVPDTERIEDLSNQFAEDMKKYGGAFSQESQFYRPMVEKMFDTIKKANEALADAKDENQRLKENYEKREAGKDAQIKELSDQVNRLAEDFKKVDETYKTERAKFAETGNKYMEDLKTVQKDAASDKANLEAANQATKKDLDATKKRAKDLLQENTMLTNQTMDNPDGQVSRVNQREGTVWVDIGRADNLNPLMSFAVYPADTSDLGKGVKKASIEITQVLGDHLAEARVLEDKITNPIVPGDKIHTPIWSPGDKRHFALVGFMDVDGDGKNKVALLRDLISMNGGVIDCEVDERGKLNGEISPQTRYLVLGDKPSERGDPTGLTAFSKIKGEAESLGIQKISLGDLLDRMGYKPQSHLVNFGTEANPKDFKPTPEGGVNRVSPGKVSDMYKPKESTRSGNGGAY